MIHCVVWKKNSSTGVVFLCTENEYLRLREIYSQVWGDGEIVEISFKIIYGSFLF